MVDVARAADVAVSTVSRVVNGDPSVGAALRERVGRAIGEVGWEVDDRARHLRLGVSGTIGAVVGELRSVFLAAVERAARTQGLMVLAISSGGDASGEDDAVRAMCRRRVDGLIVELSQNQAAGYLARQIEHGLPVVAIDRRPPELACDLVTSDNVRGIELAYQHLVDRGHSRIAFIGDDEVLVTAGQRAATFRRKAAEHGEDAAGLVMTGSPTRDRVGAALDAVLAAPLPPTALITGNDAISVHAFQHRGLGLAGLDFVGFDDLQLSEVFDPPRSVIAQDYAAMGEAAVSMIVTRLADAALPVRQLVVPVRLLDRDKPPNRTPDADTDADADAQA